jgi:hypothetical protein
MIGMDLRANLSSRTRKDINHHHQTAILDFTGFHPPPIFKVELSRSITPSRFAISGIIDDLQATEQVNDSAPGQIRT